MPLVLPATTYDKTKALKARKLIVIFTPTGGAAVNFIGKLADLKGETTVIDSKFPGSDGINRAVDHMATEGVESIVIKDLEDVETVLTAVGGLTGLKFGTAEAFFIDPHDAALKVRYATDVFPCCMQRAGNIEVGGGWSKNPTLEFLSEKAGPITFTPNATITLAP